MRWLFLLLNLFHTAKFYTSLQRERKKSQAKSGYLDLYSQAGCAQLEKPVQRQPSCGIPLPRDKGGAF